MAKRGDKKAAIELSIGTIIIIVLGVTMLILGMVLIRNIMCSAIGMTTETNTKMITELNKYFGGDEEEVACIGEVDAIKMLPGQDNIVHCMVKAPLEARYDFTLVDYGTDITGLTKDKMSLWIKTASFGEKISPGDKSAKKVFRLLIPDNAPEGRIWLKVEIKKNGELFRTKTLDFDISRVGFIKSAMC